MKVGIAGASGYTGLELIRMLVRHPEVEISVVTSERYAGQRIDEVFPSLKGLLDLTLKELSVEELLREADFVFTALPHGTSMNAVDGLIRGGRRVVDLSADFRLRDVTVYETWYGVHSCPHLLEEAVFGLPELYRNDIKRSRLVANPGCYPTGAILALAPLLEAKKIAGRGIIVDAKSGVSGAGRNPSLTTLFCEVAEGFKAYSVGTHRHGPEIEQELSLCFGEAVSVLFVPHLSPMSRGILSTIYAPFREALSTDEVYGLYQRRYADEPFVRVCPPGTFPGTTVVRGSNYCDIGVKADERSGHVIVVSAIDNLVKGASGQAIQNMNLMCGFPETTGIAQVPLTP